MMPVKSICNEVLLTCCAAIFGGSRPAPLYAETIVFQFAATIDTRPAGGSEKAPLVVTYAFDSNLQNNSGNYGPIVITIQAGDEIVTASGSGTAIFIFNDTAEDRTDGYGVVVDNWTGKIVTGTLFGMPLNYFSFAILGNAMFDSSALPLSPAFAGFADSDQSVLELVDPTNLDGSGTLRLFANSDTGFSLTQSYEPIFDIIVEIAALELPDTLQHPLLQKLHVAMSSVTGATPNDAAAIGQLQAFINQIDAESGKSLSPEEADALVNAAEFVILGLLAGG